MLRGAGRRAAREQDGRAWLAWHVEALARQKRLPKLDALLGQKTPARHQPPQDMSAVAARWHRVITAR